ncbi:MAG: inositol monophosphatase family protein [Mariprofundales bacterium]|nr:inositol monophosphatase family protein [Mariprofundales bacterium]
MTFFSGIATLQPMIAIDMDDTVVQTTENTHHAIAKLLRHVGHELILPAFFAPRQRSEIAHKCDGSMVTETDHASQEMIRQELATLAPQIGFLGEEMDAADQLQLLNRCDTPCWCLDPLDGTSNFIAGMPCFTISLGLLHQGRAIAGWIYDPVRDELFSATPSDNAIRCNGTPLPPPNPPALAEAVGYVDFKRLPHQLAQRLVIQAPWHSQRNLGSCALEWAWLASGRSQFIIHGGESVWDFAAGLALANKSGVVVRDFAGKAPLASRQLNSSIIAAANQSLFDGLHLATQLGSQ